MKLERLRAVTGEDEIAAALVEALKGQADQLPLERFCRRGGWPLSASISSITVRENSPVELVCTLYVSFTETGAACCSGDNFEHQHFEELLMVMCKETWTGRFPVDD